MLYDLLIPEISVIAFCVFFFLKFWSFDVKNITDDIPVYSRPNNFYFHIN